MIKGGIELEEELWGWCVRKSCYKSESATEAKGFYVPSVVDPPTQMIQVKRKRRNLSFTILWIPD